jgi:S-adenosylmethionine decarboxylase
MKLEGNVIQEAAESKDYFFEGTEKLLEVWFASSVRGENADLREVDRSEWERLLKNVNCEIISSKSNNSITAYLLSESSMFVSKNRIILKTCGKTTLLEAVKPLLELVHNKCGFDIVADMFYSHKNYMRPELQPITYHTFDDEVAVLDTMFDDGAAYALGRINHDCWYLYTMDSVGIVQPDQTLEILMTQVDPSVMSMFTQEYGLTAEQLTDKTGISDIFPEAIIDDFLFEPCGYSMNAIMPNGCYFTIHITPEDEFSYVSFETNVPQETYHDLISNVLDIFKPNKFVLTLCANELSKASNAHRQMNDTWYKGFKRQDHQLCLMKNYYLAYTLYSRPRLNGLSPPE